MESLSERVGHVKEKATMEMKLFLVVAGYLFITFSSFTIHTALVGAEHRMDYEQLGENLVESLILAKVILIGDLLHINKRFKDWPLIVSSLYNALVFSILVFVFTIIERLVKGLLHGKALSEAVQQFAGNATEVTEVVLAKSAIMFLTFIPFFAIWEMGRMIGEQRMIDLFFSPRAAGEAPVAEA
jgi:hypothetical protein